MGHTREKEIISKDDRVMFLGDCFATELGNRMIQEGYDVVINPFGTLFNPQNIQVSIDRMRSGEPFTLDDCVPMGAGAGKICSFFHHTSFARVTADEFLANANAELGKAAARWKDTSVVVVSLGSAQVWRRNGVTVTNCLKRPGYEFTHEMLSIEEVRSSLESVVSDGKRYIFIVSPIRHMGEGDHINSLSKSTLHLGIGALPYFHAYEILIDSLRDYSWYAENKTHPSKEAVGRIWDEFRKEYLLF